MRTCKVNNIRISYILQQCNVKLNKFALLWGEAQLCFPYVCLKKKIAYKVTYSYPKVT